MTDYLVGLAILASVNGILALGLTILTPFTGYVSIAAAAVAGVGAYVFAVLTTAYGVTPIVAAAAAVASGGLAGLLMSFIVARLKGVIHLLGTLALQLLIVEVLRRWRDVTGGDAGIAGVGMLYDGMNVTMLFALALVSLAAIAGVLHVWLKGIQGLRLRAIRDDGEVAAAAGGDVGREVRMVFVLSGCIMSYAGVLLAMYLSFLQPGTFGLEWSMMILLMVMLGGANVFGCLVAALGLTILPELIYFSITVPGMQVAATQNIVYGLVLVVLMLLKPRGLFGELRLRLRAGAVRARRPRDPDSVAGAA